MNYDVYAIESLKSRRIYVGMSSNVGERVKEHNKGRVFATKGYRPWKLIYQESCGKNQARARKREKYFKSGCGKEFLKNVVVQN